jgi:germination protein M
MVWNGDNDIQAARLGLNPVIPEGTKFDLDIANGRARIDLSTHVLSIPDAEKEWQMVSAIVQTLTQFDTVDTVEFLIGGQKRNTLSHGTDVSGAMSGGLVNLESISPTMSISDAKLVHLFFPDASGRVLVPVTRAVWGEADINTAVFELIRGPKEDATLRNVMPADTGLVDVRIESGIVTINFSEEFAKLAASSDGGQQALRALMLTCMQYPGVKNVELLVNGQPFSPAALEKPTSVNMIGQAAVHVMDVIEID